MAQAGRGAAHNLLFYIILSPKYFVSDRASIMEVNTLRTGDADLRF